MSEKNFAINNPAMLLVARLGDVALLNVYFVLCSLPIFTIGASLTAMYATALKMVRKEDDGITKTFFRAFKLNFKQATIIWVMMFVFGLFLVADFYLVSQMENPNRLMLYALYFISGVYMFTLMYVFPLLARFENTIKNTIVNAMLMFVAHLPQTVLMIGIVLVLGLLFLLPYVEAIVLFAATFFGFAGIALIWSYFFRTIFERYENSETLE